jgi:RND family efflux transporter MFP subunit
MNNLRRNHAMKNALLLAATGLLIAGLIGCGQEKPATHAAAKEVACETATAELTTLPVTVGAVASVEPAVRAHVSTRMMGWVSRIHVREGDAVRAGQALLSIDDKDLRARREQAEAGVREAEAVVANAEATAARFRNLHERKAVSKQQLDDVTTGLERARAGLAQAQAARAEVGVHLGYLNLVAPAAGVVTRRMVEVGDMASPGQPLLYVDQLDRLKVVAAVGERDVSLIAAGDTARIAVTSLDGAVFAVPVARVIPSANPGSRTYDVELYLENPDPRLRPGMFARVDLTTGERRGVLVPRSALVVRGQLTGVFLVGDDGAARLRWIRLGDERDGRVEVLSGLSGGETVVTGSATPLHEGDRVVTRS